MMKFLSSLFSAVILVSAQAVFAETPAAQTPDVAASAVQDTGQKNYTLNRIAAVVNSDVILTSELNASLQQVVAQLNKKGTPLPDRNALTSQVMERLIVDALQIQIAERNGLTIDDNTLNEEIQTLA